MHRIGNLVLVSSGLVVIRGSSCAAVNCCFGALVSLILVLLLGELRVLCAVQGVLLRIGGTIGAVLWPILPLYDKTGNEFADLVIF